MAVGTNCVSSDMISYNLIILCLPSCCVNSNNEGFQYHQSKMIHVVYYILY